MFKLSQICKPGRPGGGMFADGFFRRRQPKPQGGGIVGYLRTIRAPALVAIGLTVLPGAPVSAGDAMPYVGISSASIHYAETGLSGAYESFFGQPYNEVADENRPDFGFSSGGGSRTRTDLLLGVTLGVRHNIHEGQHLTVVRDLSLSLDRQRYSLPEGIGVFRDPAKVRFQAVTLAAELELSPTKTRRFHPVLAVGGVSSQVTTRINSALLAIRDTSWTHAVYGRAGVVLVPKNRHCNRCRFSLDFRVFSTGVNEVSAGFFQGF